MDNMFYLTAEGKARLDLMTTYHLENFYQDVIGNVIIADDMFNSEICRYALLFIKDNSNWVLGHENGYYYISNINEIKGE